ncbi:F-type H+-transporting ATPase subunit epsilon [Propionibacterium cyclohexanicum]|uniref:ATP synthase epsilon chain n=1 Tax=Propionibacterium cyclohexanicum TaxID=64702 RepID=A0A1H9R0E8_9ACTN|nr:F0F1 ATP synthase subunit epsilon [Propionibacterium cyclohexanicum]SER66172.1 F-type H+-transporting ATPase subunit epsilon [Propionibacterium cyclohexanicum]
MADPLQVEVVAADGKVWEGQALSVIARTSEGDIGILANHEALMAALVPCAVEVTTLDGTDEIFAVSDGFISVFRNRVSLLSSFGERAAEISVDAARSTIAHLHERIDSGDATHEEERQYNHAVGQLRAAEKFAAKAKGDQASEFTPQPAHLRPGN